MPEAANLPEIEIFRAGRHTDMHGTVVDVSHADLAAIAAAYDPAIGEAPHVIGHPNTNAPAFGWVKKLVARNGVLFASAHGQVDGAFADMIGAGRFKKRSASFFLPQSANNPKPGAWYLRHVGWLGAAAPAIAGLRDVAFASADDDVVEFTTSDRVRFGFMDIAALLRRLRDRFIEQDGVESAEKILPSWQIDSIEQAATQEPASASFAAPQTIQPEPPEMPNEQNADFAAREASLAERQAAHDARELRLLEQENIATRKGITEFADGLVAGGKLLPRQKASVVELLFALEAGGNPTELSFAAEDGTTATVTGGSALRSLLDGLPVQVDFSEHGAGDVESDITSFAAPDGIAVDSGRAALHHKAQAFQRANAGISYIEAVRHVGG